MGGHRGGRPFIFWEDHLRGLALSDDLRYLGPPHVLPSHRAGHQLATVGISRLLASILPSTSGRNCLAAFLLRLLLLLLLLLPLHSYLLLMGFLLSCPPLGNQVPQI